MYTLDIILKIFITAITGYVVLNTIFRFHFSLDRILLLAFTGLVIISICYLETNKVFEVILTTCLIIIIFIILKICSIIKKRHGYFLFNTYKKDYFEVKNQLENLAETLEIDKSVINYNIKKPYLIIFNQVDYKTIKKLAGKLDKVFVKKPKKITMYHYWSVVIYLILVAIIWRF